MKRHGNLWARLTNFGNLVAAAKKAALGKRTRPGVAAFVFDLERQLCRLQDELQQRTYTPGGYHTFTIVRPKPRLISAAPFRDRVVHHALCNILETIFEPTFIFDSYACREGKGSHAAVDRFQEFARRRCYVLLCDVRKYFPSIDHAILKALVARKVKDEGVLWLVNRIIDHSNPQEPIQEWFPGDNLFAPAERRRGLPLGNQTSQFLANVYLDPFDHWVKETLGAKCYLRYMDDFAILSDDTRWLAEARERCRERLALLRLRLHSRKAVITRVIDGTRFLGYRVFPEYRLLPRENVVGMQRRLRRMQAEYAAGKLEWEDVRRRLAGWHGHAEQANSYRLREWLFAEVSWRRASPEAASTGLPMIEGDDG